VGTFMLRLKAGESKGVKCSEPFDCYVTAT
jgi:hypothetical protein